MIRKRNKLVRGLGSYVPRAVNFSELAIQEGETDNEHAGAGKTTDYVPSDEGAEAERMLNGFAYEEMVVSILFNLEPREKLIFTYQLLRDNGYQIDHGAFAKTLKLSRRQYMRLLETVRAKTALYVIGLRSHKGK